jgi:hypothetical protein
MKDIQMPTTRIEPLFAIGQAVNFKSFINHNGKRVEGADGLTVVHSEFIEGRSIPDWYRIKAVRPDGTSFFAAAERFFEPSASLSVILGLADNHGLLLGLDRTNG